MLIQIVNGANLHPTSFDKGRRDHVDLGAIIDNGIPVATGSIMMGSQFWAGARGTLGTWPPYILVPPFWFNGFFSLSRAFLSFSEFKANLRAGFRGFLQSRHR